MLQASSPRPPSVAVTVSPARRAFDDVAPGAVGPGWFDSSWDLRCGLEVRESAGDESLHDWIESFLSAQRVPGRTASPSSSTAIA